MSEVLIVDTSPRDGPVAIPSIRTPDKVELTNGLIRCGISKIDCVAFTHPRIRPEYNDAEEVIKAITNRQSVKIIGLAPNEIACRRALNAGVDEIGILIAASESFNKLVLGTGIRETLFKTIPAIFHASQDNQVTTRVYLLTAFICQIEGRVPLAALVELVSKLAYMGTSEITLVDTFGLAYPQQITETIRELLKLNLKTRIGVHFHNTCGMGLLNCFIAYQAGIRIFDTAVGGLSGTPFGSPFMDVGSWNVPTEDLVTLFHSMGVNTGINLDTLIESVKLAEKLANRELGGHVLKVRNSFKHTNFPEPLALNNT